MAREYPRYVGKIQLSPGDTRRAINCACCPKPACGYADVQYTWFRSDDKAYPVCQTHRKLANADLPAFLAALPAQGKSGSTP